MKYPYSPLARTMNGRGTWTRDLYRCAECGAVYNISNGDAEPDCSLCIRKPPLFYIGFELHDGDAAGPLVTFTAYGQPRPRMNANDPEYCLDFVSFSVSHAGKSPVRVRAANRADAMALIEDEFTRSAGGERAEEYDAWKRANRPIFVETLER